MSGREMAVLRQIETPLGAMRAAMGAEALFFLHFSDTQGGCGERLLPHLRPAAGAAKAAAEQALARLEAELAAYFSGAGRSFTVPLALGRHSAFRQKVWQSLAQIPYGATCSYSGQAALLGLPARFARAVAAANGQNPFPLLLPCHRVIRAGGALSGYHGGAERKAALLAHEKRHLPAGA